MHALDHINFKSDSASYEYTLLNFNWNKPIFPITYTVNSKTENELKRVVLG
jgi:hypothetical protein